MAITLENDIVRFALAGLTIVILLILESKIRKLDKGRGHLFLIINRVVLFSLYGVGIGIAIWLTGTHKILLGIEAEQGITARIIETIVLWLGAKFIVNNFSDIFKRIDDIVLKNHDLSKHAHDIIRKLFKYAVYFAAILFTLAIFDLTGAIGGVLAGAGFAGIVIGFAAKDTIGNFFAGITLLADKPYKIGDYISIVNQSVEGTVDDISIRSTRILQVNNTLVTVPNSTLANNPVINYTRNRNRRLIIPVGIAYESDINKAVKVIKRDLPKLDAIMSDKEIEVLVKGFGDSSINMEVRAWLDTKKEGIVAGQARAMQAIKESFDKNGIEIPYPRRYIINGSKKSKPKKRKK